MVAPKNLITMVALFSFSLTAEAQTAWSSRLDAVGEWLVKNEVSRAVSVMTIDGGETRIASFGRLGNGTAPNDDTLYEIGSVSKVFTGMALARRAVAGDVALGDTLVKFYPELDNRELGRVTLTELATHTSGLPTVPPKLTLDPDNPYRNFDEASLKEFLATYDLTEHPVAFDISKHYSNLGVGLLGYTLWHQVKPTFASYDAMLHALIFQELGIKDIADVLTTEQEARYARPHRASWHTTPPWEMNLLAGAGDLKASPRAFATFAEQILTGLPGDLGAAFALATKRHAGKAPSGIGLGWLIYESSDGTWYYHNGQTYGGTAVFAVNPQTHKALAVLSDTTASIPCLNEILVGKECQIAALTEAPDEVVRRAPGAYDGLARYEVTSRGHQLYGRFVGGLEERLNYQSAGSFTAPALSMTVKFQGTGVAPYEAVTVTIGSQTAELKRVTQ